MIRGIKRFGAAVALAGALTTGLAAPALADSQAEVDYDLGYDAGLVINQIYTPANSTALTIKTQCKVSLLRDQISLRNLNHRNGTSASISEPDFLAGCYKAVGATP